MSYFGLILAVLVKFSLFLMVNMTISKLNA